MNKFLVSLAVVLTFLNFSCSRDQSETNNQSDIDYSLLQCMPYEPIEQCITTLETIPCSRGDKETQVTWVSGGCPMYFDCIYEHEICIPTTSLIPIEWNLYLRDDYQICGCPFSTGTQYLYNY